MLLIVDEPVECFESVVGYKETLARLSLGVCFPLVSRHERP